MPELMQWARREAIRAARIEAVNTDTETGEVTLTLAGDQVAAGEPARATFSASWASAFQPSSGGYLVLQETAQEGHAVMPAWAFDAIAVRPSDGDRLAALALTALVRLLARMADARGGPTV